MTNRIELFQQHEVHKKVAELESILTNLSAEEFLDYQDRTSRIKHVVLHLADILNRADPQLVPLARLNHLSQLVGNLVNDLTAFFSDKNPAHFDNADNHADSILENLSSVYADQSEIATIQRDLVREYELNSKQLVLTFQGRFKAFGERLADMQQTFDARVAELNADIEKRYREHPENFAARSNEITVELSKVNTEISEQKSRLNELGSQFTKQFSEAQESRLNAFNDEVSSLRQKFDDLVERLEESSVTILAGISKKDEQATELLEAVGIKSFSTHYKKQADQERRSATLYQVLALVFLLVAAIVAYSTSIGQSNSDAGAIITHILVYIALLTPALYCAFESAKHRRQEHRNRQFELEMAAVHPYFAAIPESDAKNTKRIELADRFFGHQSGDKLEAWTPPAIKGVNMLLKTVGEVAAKMQK